MDKDFENSWLVFLLLQLEDSLKVEEQHLLLLGFWFNDNHEMNPWPGFA